MVVRRHTKVRLRELHDPAAACAASLRSEGNAIDFPYTGGFPLS